MRKLLLGAGIAVGLGLAGCAEKATVLSDTQTVINDADAILALGIVPQPEAADASLVLAGLQALENSVGSSIASGATAEATTLASLKTAVTQVQTDAASDAQVASDAKEALLVIGQLQANESGTTVQQVEAAVGTLSIDFLSGSLPVSATAGSGPSQAQADIADARTHIAKLQGE